MDRAYINSIIKSNKIIIFNDDLVNVDENERKLSEIFDLIRIYQINEDYILLKNISKLQDSLNCKAYLNTLCKRNRKINVSCVLNENINKFHLVLIVPVSIYKWD
jgi:uncharacterized protein YecE (DUF72 family)